MTELAIFHRTTRPNNFPSQLGEQRHSPLSILSSPLFFSPSFLLLPTFRLATSPLSSKTNILIDIVFIARSHFH